VHEVVAEKYGRDVADRAVIYQATKRRLAAALREAKVPAHTRAQEEVLVEVRRRGGATRKRGKDVEEYTPKKQLPGT
jgi:hypothetical protein